MDNSFVDGTEKMVPGIPSHGRCGCNGILLHGLNRCGAALVNYFITTTTNAAQETVAEEGTEPAMQQVAIHD